MSAACASVPTRGSPSRATPRSSSASSRRPSGGTGARRCPRSTPPPRFGEITIRPDLYQAYVNEVSLELTAREFEILHLLTGSDRVLRREEIYERVWGYAMAHGDRSVDVFVRKLRQKLRSGSREWNYIHTHFGVGYRFSPEHESSVEEELDLITSAHTGDELDTEELNSALAG